VFVRFETRTDELVLQQNFEFLVKQYMQSSPNISDLKHHFHEYFELLLGIEKQRLLHDVATSSPERAAEFSHDIEVRFAYLKGAIRMGRLLGLISSEEAKTKHNVLSALGDELQSSILARVGKPVTLSANDISHDGRERMQRLLEKMMADRGLPPIDWKAE
jgi:hypothetical protein